jgi:predicted cobalt transporter CbtA
MGVGEIAGLIAAIAFAVLAGFMIYPLIRLGKLFDQIAQTVKDTGDHAIPALDEGVTTVQGIGHIQRGYADLAGDLRALGARITEQ